MGMDIHMSIIDKNGKYIAKEIYNGRDSEWFRKLLDHEDFYDELISYYDIPDNVPDEIRTDFDRNVYFSFNYVSTKAFSNWFEKYRPDIDAGWVTTRDKWLYEARGIMPELEYRLPEDAAVADWHFIKVEDEYDGNLFVYNYIHNNNIPINEDTYVIYYFDN